MVLGIFALTSVEHHLVGDLCWEWGFTSFDLLADYFDRGRDVRLWFWQIRRDLAA